MTQTSDCIEKSIELRAPLERVWRALTDHREFNQWFRVALQAPFEPGKKTRGPITYPGYEHLEMEVEVQAMESPHRFSFTWHPYAIDPNVDYSREAPTLVEFTLEETAAGTRLVVRESGFDKIPTARRAEAFRMNEGGWAEQLRNIAAHVG